MGYRGLPWVTVGYRASLPGVSPSPCAPRWVELWKYVEKWRKKRRCVHFLCLTRTARVVGVWFECRTRDHGRSVLLAFLKRKWTLCGGKERIWQGLGHQTRIENAKMVVEQYALWDFEDRVQGTGCRVQGAGCRVQGAGYRVQGAGRRAQGAGYRVQGAGYRVQGAQVISVICICQTQEKKLCHSSDFSLYFEGFKLLTPYPTPDTQVK